MRLDERGVVDAFIGRPPEQGRLTEVSAAARDFSGRFYLLDRRTASIHVFDPDGTFSHRCDPAPGDFDEQVEYAQLTTTADGTVYLSNEDGDRYFVYDADGRRVEQRSTRLDTVSEDWYGHPQGTDLWIGTMDDLYLTDAVGNVLHRIRRHRDRTWLEAPRAASVSNDGTVALITGKRDFFAEGASLGLFTVDGEAVLKKDFPRLDPFTSIAFDGDLIVFGTESELLFMDRRGEPLGRFVPDSGYNSNYWRHFVTRGGRELQLLDVSVRRVYRYDVSTLRRD